MRCGKMIESGFVGFPCEVEVRADGHHDGPCMSKDAPRSVAERERWQEGQRGIAQFQSERRAVETMVDPNAITTLRSHRRVFRPEYVGVVEIVEGRWAVNNGWNEWLPLFEVSKLSGFDLSTFPSIPCYVRVGGEIGVLVDDRTEESIQAQAQTFVCGRRTDAEVETINVKVEAVTTPARVVDQPPPVEGESDMWAEVLLDMEERRKLGIERYGTPLQRWNGRDAGVDAYQEVLDLAVYLKQFSTERESLRQLVSLVRNGWDAPEGSIARETADASLVKLLHLLGVEQK